MQVEIRTLKSAAQQRMSPTALASLLAESEMALGLPCVVASIGEAVRLLGLTDKQCEALQSTLARGGLWKGMDHKEAQLCCIRLAAEAF
ncbi:hypothetical protein [Sinorhizobium fredii]|uniref:hypothetical protein n=1 Tax=Rhizobium fredii TaxID=380 RepID=UPI003398F057